MKGSTHFGWLAAALFFIGCSMEPRSLVYVFPDNFHGIFKARADPNGVPVRPQSTTITLSIPPSGVLLVKGELPNRRWYSTSARFVSGKVIPISEPAHPLSKDELALRSVGSKAAYEDWFVVGTYSDAAKAQEQLRGFKWP